MYGMTHMRLFPWLACALASACSNLPPEPNNPVLAQQTWGVASGRSELETSELVAIVNNSLPHLRAMEGFVDMPLRIHLTDDLGAPGRAGITIETSLGDSWVAVVRAQENLAFVVAHELAHFYFQEYQALFSPVLEEGLCDLIADQIYGTNSMEKSQVVIALVSYMDRVNLKLEGPLSKSRIARLMLDVPPLEEVLAYASKTILQTDDLEAQRIYGIGQMLAINIGLQGLQQLAERCQEEGRERVPIAWILEAAELDPLDQEHLEAAFRRALGGEDVEATGNSLQITLKD